MSKDIIMPLLVGGTVQAWKNFKGATPQNPKFSALYEEYVKAVARQRMYESGDTSGIRQWIQEEIDENKDVIEKTQIHDEKISKVIIDMAVSQLEERNQYLLSLLALLD